MKWTPDLPIRAQPRGTSDQARAFIASPPRPTLNTAEIFAYITELWRLAPLVGLDPAILFAQAVHETGAFTSAAWRDRLNPAGIGITDGGDHGYRWASGTEAARAHVVHMDVYVNGVQATPVGGDVLAPYYALNPRRQAVIAAGWAGTVRTIRDLTGKWATDPAYHEKVVAWAARLFGEVAMTGITFGRVPHPPFQDRLIPDAQTRAWNDLGPRTIRGIVWHRMVGTLWGTDSWFRRGTAATGLTEYGIGVLAADGGGNDGLILRWNDPLGRPAPGVSPNRAPWASGPVKGAYGDGLAFVNEFGVEAVNRDQVAIEISGKYDTPLSEASRNAIAALTAYWADQMRVPWDQFPIWPGHGYSVVRWHQEFCLGTGKVCPGRVVIEETAALIERTRAILKRHQTGEAAGPAPQYAKPSVPSWVAEDLALGRPRDHVLNRVQVWGCLREWEAVRETPRRRRATLDSAVVGPPIKLGERFTGWWVFEGRGERWWILTPYGTRVLMADCTPVVRIEGHARAS